MLDSRKMSNLLDLKEVWPQLTDCYTPIEERVDPVMPLLVDLFREASFTVRNSAGEKMRYKLLDERTTLVTNETKNFSTKVSSYVFFRRMLWEEAAFRMSKSPMMTPAYRRGYKLEKIIRQVEC